MRATVAALCILLAISLFATLNHAATQQLLVDHALTGYTKSPSSVTLDYTLHVVNPGAGTFFNLSLSLAPLPPLIAGGTSVTVGYLGPHESTDVTLQISTPAMTDPEQFSHNSLFWIGKHEDLEGKPVEFPLRSRPGTFAKK
jgi:hypothetical protein